MLIAADIIKEVMKDYDEGYFLDYEDDYCFGHVDRSGVMEKFDESFLSKKYARYAITPTGSNEVMIIFYN